MAKGSGIGTNKFAMRNVTPEQLRALYWDDQLSQWQIAARFGVTQGAVKYWMDKWEIPARSHDDSLLVLGKSGRFTGEKNPRWTGGRITTANGYEKLRMPEHPRADNRGYVLEHHVVWEEANGKPLPPKWHVHHKNGDKTDNRPENLEAMPWLKHRALLPELLLRIGELESQLKEAHDELERLRAQSSSTR